ncbi:hypothetical protein H4219_001949 [Mycoemilia scoparia]|uniref:Ran guanine nucleotide release factor n=1 Tax=Mycoemilia scoparia TaxID=417184 RepID=A0A9W8A875_9FUNG|nr:hypothetical protein H4219_001949 [Mycoemilia scoparia]
MVLELRELFGGAMSTELPSEMLDMSNFRQIPDNQEVFADTNDHSFIVEIVEMAENAGDQSIVEYHFKQLVQDNEAADYNILERETVSEADKPVIKSPNPSNSSITISTLTGVQTIAKFNEATKSQDAYNQVVIFMAVVRIPEHTADILLTANCPVSVGADSSSTALDIQGDRDLQGMHCLFQKAVNTFRIKDWSLFA